MPRFDITISKSAIKEIESLSIQLVERIWYKIENLCLNPRPKGCIKLQGNNNLWRLRVGDYRVLYSISDKDLIVDIIAIKHRKDAYK